MIGSHPPTYAGRSEIEDPHIDAMFASIASALEADTASVDRADIEPFVPAEPIVRATRSGPTGFFTAAVDGVALGRISGDTDAAGRPNWLAGVCWRPSRCLTPSWYEVDCVDCGDEDAATWDPTAPAANQSAKAFEVVFRDRRNRIGTHPISADDLRARMGESFGENLWSRITPLIDADTMAVPAALAGSAWDPEVAVQRLEHETGFAGDGTLLAPADLIAYLLEKHAVHLDRGVMRTTTGNRVLTEGISIHTRPSGTASTANVAMVGPVDYAATPIVDETDSDGTVGGNDNQTAQVVSMFGLVRTDLCAAMRAAVILPISGASSVAETS